jgi:hypothetical protein
MNVKELREVLAEAEGILTAAGAKGPSKEFRAFLDLLGGRDDQPVAEFLAELRGRLNGSQPASATEANGTDERVVAYYVERLKVADTARHQFDMVYADLSGDRRVGKAEADAIAHRYTGGRDKWPKKSEALEAIKNWFRQGSYQSVKMKQVDKATGDAR